MNPHNLAKEHACQYSGDVNLEYGGVFYETKNWKNYGYASAIRITDLDSACGFTGGVLIESIVINRPDDIQRALDAIGADDTGDTAAEIEACLAYGHYEPAFDVFNSVSETVTTDPENWEYDGWKAEKHVTSEDLPGYVASCWLARVF